MPTLLIAAVLLAGPTGMRLASPGFSGVNVEKKTAEFFSDHFAQQLVVRGFTVTTGSEMTALIGLERQKQLVGCSDQGSSCLAELAGALGADGIIVGSIARFEGGYAVDIKIVAASNAKTLGVFTGRLANVDALLDWLARAAQALGKQLGMTARPDAPDLDAPPRSLKPLIPAAAGVVLAGGSLLPLVLARNLQSQMTAGDRSVISGSTTINQVARRGNNLQTAAAISAGAGVACLAAAGLWALLGGGGSATVALAPQPGGAVVSLAWSAP